MFDYSRQSNTHKKLMNKYFNLFAEKILFGKYGSSNEYLHEIINDKWQYIDYNEIINFTVILSKMKYYSIDVSQYEKLFSEKFNQEQYIIKLLDFTKKRYLSNNTSVVQDINEDTEKSSVSINYELRFIIGVMKSNGFSFFEKYYSDMLTRHKELEIGVLKRELRMVNNFINILVQQDQTSVNRYVNDMLIRARNYLLDLEESYYNNTIYKKIKISCESDKYKSVDLSIYNRELSNFRTVKYNYSAGKENIFASSHNLGSESTDDNLVISTTNISPSLQSYLDMYVAYYKVRYPDRLIEYDLINSTIIVKMNFLEETYLIHMALLQYIVLDIIMENSLGVSVQFISDKLQIPLNKLSDTFNSLLKIRIVKRTSGDTNPNEIKFLLNTDFTHENKKISISGLIKPSSVNTEVKKEFLHDRDMIVLANLINYAKKNTYFTRDTIGEQLSYKIPFKLSDEHIEKAIEKALKDEYIKSQEIPTGSGQTDVIFQYLDA
jgi:hypothetical protein